jgi:hypothetical protein
MVFYYEIKFSSSLFLHSRWSLKNKVKMTQPTFPHFSTINKNGRKTEENGLSLSNNFVCIRSFYIKKINSIYAYIVCSINTKYI